jgi:hypothetical protein
VVRIDSNAVVVEVRDAPGLKPGTQVRFALDAFLSMVEVDRPPEQTGPEV